MTYTLSVYTSNAAAHNGWIDGTTTTKYFDVSFLRLVHQNRKEEQYSDDNDSR